MKRKNTYFIKFIFFIALLGSLFIISLLFNQNPVVAQEYQGIIVSPPYLTETLEPFIIKQKTFYITNSFQEEHSYKIIPRTVVIDQDGEFYVPENFEYTLAEDFINKGWLVITPSEFTLDPNESITVTVDINIQEEIPTNGYYLELAVTIQDPVYDGNQVNLIPEVSIPVAINFTGQIPVVYRLKIKDFYVQGKPESPLENPQEDLTIIDRVRIFFETKNIFEYSPIIFYSTIENTGNSNVIPKGQIFISKDPEFKTLEDTIEFNELNKMVFAGTSRKYETEWNNAMLEYNEESGLKINWDKNDKFRFGKYHAQLNIIWESENREDYSTANIEFWIIPWRIITVVVLILFIIILIITYFIVKHNRSEKINDS